MSPRSALTISERERSSCARRGAPEAEDSADRAADRLAVEEIGARVGQEQRVDTGSAGRPRDRAEVPRTLDRHGDYDEGISRQVEVLELGRGPPDDGEKAVRLPLRQAREGLHAQLDHGGTAAVRRSEKVCVATAGEQVRRDVHSAPRRRRKCRSHRPRALGETELRGAPTGKPAHGLQPDVGGAHDERASCQGTPRGRERADARRTASLRRRLLRALPQHDGVRLARP